MEDVKKRAMHEAKSGLAELLHEIEAEFRPCLKNGKTPSLGIFFRQDCVDLT